MKKFLSIVLVLMSISTYSQKDEKIAWNENSALTWEDFRAEPDKTADYVASTNSGISYTWNYSTASGEPVLEHEVITNFYPNLSWVKDLDPEDSAHILAHEQLHFDISELFARKLRKALDEYEIGRNIRLDLKKIYSDIERKREEMQRLYDLETSHSQNREEEIKWQKLIAQQLKQLVKFSG